MTAKELKSNNRVYKVSLEGKDFIQYEFTEDELEAFCAQLCKEQLEIANKPENEDDILNAPMPEL